MHCYQAGGNDWSHQQYILTCSLLLKEWTSDYTTWSLLRGAQAKNSVKGTEQKCASNRTGTIHTRQHVWVKGALSVAVQHWGKGSGHGKPNSLVQSSCTSWREGRDYDLCKAPPYPPGGVRWCIPHIRSLESMALWGQKESLLLRGTRTGRGITKSMGEPNAKAEQMRNRLSRFLCCS